jgi:pyruvate/2-oxoglutarate/acetoin dehydrogenase E1 component
VRRPVTEPLGRAAVRRRGDDVTVVTYGGMLPRCLDAADALALEGIEAEVLDLRTVFPADHDAIAESVTRTGRLVVVHEDTRSSGVGAEIAARVAEDLLYVLDAPIVRVTAPDAPVPFARPLEEAYVPSFDAITAAVRGTAAA